MKPTGKTHTVTRKTAKGHIVAECKLSDHGQGPYLSCTYTEFEGRRDVAGGAGTPEMWEKLGLTRLARWHLVSLDRGPMHYVANAVYWAENAAGVGRYERRSYDPDPREAFAHTVCLGVLEGDEMPTLDPFPGQDVGDVDPNVIIQCTREHIARVVPEWCEKRLPALMSAFEADLRHFGLIE